MTIGRLKSKRPIVFDCIHDTPWTVRCCMNVFRLKSLPRTFEREMEVIQTPVKWSFAVVYPDDIVVFSGSPRAHLSCPRSPIPLKTCRGDPEVENISLIYCHDWLPRSNYTTTPTEITTDTIDAIKTSEPPRTSPCFARFLDCEAHFVVLCPASHAY